MSMFYFDIDFFGEGQNDFGGAKRWELAIAARSINFDFLSAQSNTHFLTQDGSS